MLSIFRSNQLPASILLLFYVALLHIASFIVPTNWEPSGYGMAMEYIYNTLGIKTISSEILTIVLVFIQGVLAVYLDLSQKLTSEPTLFSGLFLILLSSLCPAFIHLSPLHFANIFLLLAMIQINFTYRNTKCADQIYNAGLMVGLAALFQPTYLVFLLYIFASLNSLRGFSIRERLMVLAGVFTVYFLAGTWSFWTDSFDLFWNKQFTAAYSFWDFTQGSYFTLIHLGIILLVLLFVLVVRPQFLSKQKMEVQKKVNLLYWAILTSLLTVLIQPGVTEDHMLAVVPMLGILLGFFFTLLKKNHAELFHFIFLILVLFLQFRIYFFPAM